MNLYEFVVKWMGNYTPEQIETYNTLYGEERDRWPQTDDTSLITIDVHTIVRFNPGEDEACTTVELVGARAYCICMSYEEFKSFLDSIGIVISKAHAL